MLDNFLDKYNVITLILAAVLLAPIIIGLFRKVTKVSIWISLISLLRVAGFLLSIAVSFFLTKKLFFESQIPFFLNLKDYITQNFKDTVNPEIIVYLIAAPVIFIFVTLLFKLLTLKVETRLFDVLSGKLFEIFDSLWQPLKIFIKAIFQIPKAVFNTIFVCLMLSLFSIYLSSPTISEQLEESRIYKAVDQYAIQPLINSSYAQKLPVLFNQSMAQLDESQLPEVFQEDGSLPEKLISGTRIIWYFNGVTLEDAVKSNSEIDAFTVELIKSETSSRKKARIIYKWIGSHIKYDFEKAEKVSNNIGDTSSGAIQAFNTRKGICFDSSALYVTMCKAVGLKTRLVVGMGFNGLAWGEHAWNQVYIPEEDKWINVDTTFAVGGNYFDRPNFEADHRAARTAGEW